MSKKMNKTLKSLALSFGKLVPDKLYLKIFYKKALGKKLDLNNPVTYNEKIQWMKLYYRKKIMTELVDKYEVRKHITKAIGEEYLFPLYGVWDSPEEIDYDALPDQFVLKCTHDSGSVVICKDKSKLDIPAAKAKLSKHLKRNYYWTNREWPYKNVPPRIIAEKYMEDETGELRDFKFLCFNGIAKMIELHSGRFEKHTQDFYDAQWKRLDIIQGVPMADELPYQRRQLQNRSRPKARGFQKIQFRSAFLY